VAFSKMGFKNFFDIKQMGFNDVGWGAPDTDLFNYTLKSLEQVNGPFFSYIITLTSHTPFNSVKNYYNNNLFDSIKDEKIKNYFTSFSYVDKAIEDFIKEIKSKYSDTYILIFGDHTPDINTVEYKQAAFQNGDSYMEFVPFIILTPDNKSFIEDKSVASFLDIAPTILEASGIQYSYSTDGKNLMDSSIIGKEIPFEGRLYDRNELLNRLLEELN
jgi:phosphoglycerol transferase MdoB-like AlkP superfamily enzyme